MSTSRALRLAAALLAATALAAPAARADWLVTRDGARVETTGPWQIKGKLLVFTTAAGDLASLRVADVDLDASRAATEQAAAATAQAAAKKPAAKRRPVRVLTDKDFPKAAPAAPAAAAKKEEGTKPEAAAAALQVTAWEREQDSFDRHVVISGSVRNTGAETAADAGLVVRLFDEEGGLVASVAAELPTTVLPAGGSTSFRADFPGVFAFAAVKFETRAMRLQQAPAPQPSR